MHHWGIPVALNVRSNALKSVAPRYLTHLVTLEAPRAEAAEVVVEFHGHLGLHKVDEAVAKVGHLLLEVHGEID